MERRGLAIGGLAGVGCALVLLALGSRQAQAAGPACTYVFTGGSAGTQTDWDAPSSWQGGTVPGANAQVCILAGRRATFGQGTLTVTGINDLGVQGGTYGGELTVGGGSLTLALNAGNPSVLAGVHLAGGTLDVNGLLSAASFTQDGGSFDGTGALTFTSAADWEAGSMQPTASPAGSTLVGSGGATLTVAGAGAKHLGAGRISTDGPIRISGSQLDGSGQGSVSTTSAVTLDSAAVSGDINLSTGSLLSTSSGASTLAGSRLHLTGPAASEVAGPLTVGSLRQDPAASVGVDSGATLTFAGSASSSTLAGTVAGPGTVAFAAGTVSVSSTGSVSTSAASVSGATVTGTGGWSTTASLVVSSGTLDLDSTSSTGALTLSGGQMQGTGNLTVHGSLSWTGGAMTPPHRPASGFAVSQDAGRTASIGGPSALAFGLTLHTASPLTISGAGIAASATPEGPARLVSDAGLTLASGTVLGQASAGAPASVLTQSLSTLGAGAQLGAAAVEVTGDGSTLRGTVGVGQLTIDPGSTVSLASATTVNVGGGTLTVGGALTGAGTAAITVGVGGVVEAGSGSTMFVPAVTVSGGSLHLLGSYTAGASTTLAAGTLTIDHAASTGALSISGGTLAGTATLSVSGDVLWTAGQISPTAVSAGNVVQGAGRTFSVQGAGQKRLFGGRIVTASPVSISGGGLTLGGPVSLDAGAGVSFGSGASVTTQGLTLSTASVTTSGSGADASGVDVVLTGAGSDLAAALAVRSLAVPAGAVLDIPTGTTLTSGATTLSGGALLVHGTHQGPVTLTGGGQLLGTGAVNGSVTNTSGTVGVGDDPSTDDATLRVGTFSQGAEGTLAVHIGGTASPQRGRLLVTGGTPALDGTLDLRHADGYAPPQPFTYSVLERAVVPSGTFATILGADAGGSDVFVATYSDQGVVVTISPTPTVAVSALQSTAVTLTPTMTPPAGLSPAHYLLTIIPEYGTLLVEPGASRVDGLDPGRDYGVSAQAVYDDGSVSAEGTTTSFTTPPGPPAPVSAVSTERQVSVTFGPAPVNGATVTSYTVTLTGPEGAMVRTTPGPGSVTFTGLTDVTTYVPSVTATDAGGVGPAGTGAPVTTPATSPPSAPTDLSAVAGDTVASISFGPPVSGMRPTSYVVTLTPTGGGAAVVTTAVEGPVVVGGLLDGTTYDVSVVAVSSIGPGPAAGGVQVTPRPVPGAVVITGIAPRPRSLDIAVALPVAPGSPLLDVTVVCVAARPGAPSGTVTGPGPVLRVTGLADRTDYVCSATASNAVGRSLPGPFAAGRSGPVPKVRLNGPRTGPTGHRVVLSGTATSADRPAAHRVVTLTARDTRTGRRAVLARVRTDARGRFTVRARVLAHRSFRVTLAVGPTTVLSTEVTVRAV